MGPSLRKIADWFADLGRRTAEAWRELRQGETPENEARFERELAHMRRVRHGAEERRRTSGRR